MQQQQQFLPDELPEYIDSEALTYELWMRGDLEFLLWEQQEPIWDLLMNLPPHIIEFVVLCARQFGKSTFGVIIALATAIKRRDCCILIMGPDTKQTLDIVLPKMRFLTRTAPKGLIRQMKAQNRYHVYHDLDPHAQDYTEIIIGGMNDGSSSQRGKTVELILIEEIGDLNEDDYLVGLREELGPTLTHSKSGKILFLTTLPPVPDHPFITETIPKAQARGALAVYTIDDNKALTQEQYDACVERAGGKDSVAFEREYLCKVVRDRNRVVLPDFATKVNVQPVVIPAVTKMHVTIDWGGVRDKTCAVLHTYDYLSELHLFIDERVFDPNTPSSEIIRVCKEMEALYSHSYGPIYQRWIDAPPQFVMVDLHSEPFNYVASLPNKLDWKSCINTLNVAFCRRKTIIDPRCKFLIRSAQSATFNKKKLDFERTEVLGHADGIAAMMYAERMVSRENPYPIEHRPDDFVGFQNAHTPVGSPHQQKEAPVVVLDPFQELNVPRGFGKFRQAR